MNNFNNPYGYPMQGYPVQGYGYQQPVVYRPPVQQMTQQPPMISAIPGRVVNTFEDIRPNEVPGDGSISVFPQGDLSCIYVRYIAGDGTIKTRKFVEETEAIAADMPSTGQTNQNGTPDYAALNEKLDKIDKKLSKLFYKKPMRKEGDANANVDE